MKTFKEILTEGKFKKVYSHKLKDGEEYAVVDRIYIKGANASPNQDKYQMMIIDKKGKMLIDMGTHPSANGIPANKKIDSLKDFQSMLLKKYPSTYKGKW